MSLARMALIALICACLMLSGQAVSTKLRALHKERETAGGTPNQPGLQKPVSRMIDDLMAGRREAMAIDVDPTDKGQGAPLIMGNMNQIESEDDEGRTASDEKADEDHNKRFFEAQQKRQQEQEVKIRMEEIEKKKDIETTKIEEEERRKSVQDRIRVRAEEHTKTAWEKTLAQEQIARNAMNQVRHRRDFIEQQKDDMDKLEFTKTEIAEEANKDKLKLARDKLQEQNVKDDERHNLMLKSLQREMEVRRTKLEHDMQIAQYKHEEELKYKEDQFNSHAMTKIMKDWAKGFSRQNLEILGEMESQPAFSCQHVLALRRAAEVRCDSGSYWIKPRKWSGKAIRVYCDMTTNGGGWALVAAASVRNKPQFSILSSSEVNIPYPSRPSGKYPDAFITALMQELHSNEVMVEENSDISPDVKKGLVMVYKLPKGAYLHFEGTAQTHHPEKPVFEQCWRQFKWRTPTGWRDVVDNRCGSSNWWGLSVHGQAFRGIPPSQRCLFKNDFNRRDTGATNGDYKLDHDPVNHRYHTGTTRCSHGTVEYGVVHFVRSAMD